MTAGIWRLLGIDATTSKGDIRKAYAARLRQTRPEDDPAGFQQLHAAYKQALAMADWNGTERQPEVQIEYRLSVDPPEAGTDPGGTVEQTEPPETAHDRVYEVLAPPPPPPPPDPPRLSDAQRADIASRLEQLDALTTSYRDISNPAAWSFLTEAYGVLDDDYRIELGRAVLERIMRHNKAMIERKNRFDTVSPQVLGELDKVFFWSSSPDLFIDDENAGEVFALLGDIDEGVRRTEAAPVGGELVRKRPRRRTDEQQQRKSSEGVSWWQVWVILWLGIAAIRACGNLT